MSFTNQFERQMLIHLLPDHMLLLLAMLISSPCDCVCLRAAMLASGITRPGDRLSSPPSHSQPRKVDNNKPNIYDYTYTMHDEIVQHLRNSFNSLLAHRTPHDRGSIQLFE